MSFRSQMGRQMTDKSETSENLIDYEGVFGEHYLHFYGPDLTPERSAREAEVIWRLLSLESGDAVLDLGCGHGRIAIELAKRGAEVTGLDRSPAFLDLARKDAAAANVPVTFVEGDMRDLPWRETFDAVVIWFTTFGYFDDDENEQVLREVAKALRPGGRLLIEQIHRNALLRQGMPNNYVVQRGDDLMVDLVNYDVLGDRTRTERVMLRDGRVHRTAFSIRLYGFAELARLLQAVGFREIDGFGRDGEPLTLYSRRLLTRACK